MTMMTFQPPGFQPHHLETDLGTMVYYSPDREVWGPTQTAVPLVFLHSLGGGSSAFEWSKVYPAFASTHPVIAPDLIGWGQSAHPARAYRVEDYMQLIAQLLEQVVQTPAVVVASSLTAGTVIRLAIQQPELFRGLFLVSPSGNADFGRDYRLSLPALLAATPGVDALLYQFGAANELAVNAFLSTFLFANPARIRPDIPQAYLAGTQKVNAAYSALASLKGDISFDLARYMPQLTIPTTIVLGRTSRFTPLAVARRLASLNPQVVNQVYEVADSGVLPHLEHPAVVIGLLTQSLQSLP